MRRPAVVELGGKLEKGSVFDGVELKGHWFRLVLLSFRDMMEAVTIIRSTDFFLLSRHYQARTRCSFFSAIAIYFLGVLLVDSRLTSAMRHCCAPATINLGIYQSHGVSSALSHTLPVPKVWVYPRKG